MNLILPANKNLRRYFFADIVSQFGSGMSFIGLNWFLLAKTGMNKEVGLLMVIGIVSGLIITPFAGPIADHFNRKLILIYTNFARALLILLTVILLFIRPFNVYYIYFLAIVNGVGWNLYLPASRALVQEIVSKEDLLQGNSLVEISLQAGMFTAGAAAGIIYKFFGLQTILIVDAATFIISNFLLFHIRYKSVARQISNESVVQKFLKGYQYLAGKSVIFIFGIIIFLPFVATMTFNVVLPGYVGHYLHAGSLTFGLLDMCYGIGASLAGFVTMYLSLKYRKNILVIFFFIMSMVALGIMLVNKYFIIAYIATILFGLPNSAIRIILNSVVMEIIPNEYMGRVMSIWNFVATFLQVIAAYTAGVIMDKSSAISGYGCLLSIMVIAFLSYLYFSKKIGKSVIDSESPETP